VKTWENLSVWKTLNIYNIFTQSEYELQTIFNFASGKACGEREIFHWYFPLGLTGKQVKEAENCIASCPDLATNLYGNGF